MRPFLTAGATILLTVTALSLSGCGPSAMTTSALPASVEHRVAREVRDVLSSQGVTVDYGYVGCNVADSARQIQCYAVTTDEPTKEVSATFAPQAGRTCPGLLTVNVGSTALPSRTTDPCR